MTPEELRRLTLALPRRQRIEIAQAILTSLHQDEAATGNRFEEPNQQFDEPLLDHVDLEDTVSVEAGVERKIILSDSPLPPPLSQKKKPSMTGQTVAPSSIADTFQQLRDALENNLDE